MTIIVRLDQLATSFGGGLAIGGMTRYFAVTVISPALPA